MMNAECRTKRGLKMEDRRSQMHNNARRSSILNPRSSASLLRSAFCILTSAFIMTLPGCEIPGVLLQKALGEAPVAAQYVPPKGPTLVLVENYRSPDEMQLDGDQIAHEVTDELKKDGKL